MKAFDLVVVGHGAAGLCAALAAAETARHNGVPARITVIESALREAFGGNSRYSPSYIRMPSVEGVAASFVEDIMAESGPRAARAYFERLASVAPAALKWLQGHGLQFNHPLYYLAAGPKRIQPVGGGTALVAALFDAAQRAGVEFRYGTAASQLLVEQGNEARAVVGVRLADGTQLPANAVILASGSFAANGDMLAQHFGAAARGMKPLSPGTAFNQGEGIRMALAVGAQASGDWTGMHAEPVDARSAQSAAVVLVYPYGIVVNNQGQRFFDEGAGLVHETWEHFARSIQMDQAQQRAWAILDSRLHAISDWERAVRSEVPPFQADSIAELAKLLGLDATALAATITAYNAATVNNTTGFDATHTDGLHTVPGYAPPKSNWAQAIDRPPFLAWPLQGAVAYTFGGLATDVNAQVLGQQGPIPGLYAAGEITGHFYGTAPNAVAMLRAIVFGRIAGQCALTPSREQA